MSALTPAGSTRAWRQLRAAWNLRLINAAAAGHPIACPRCAKPIHPNQAWDLGHTIDRAAGGTDRDGLQPEHAACNRRAGQATSQVRKLRW